MENVKCPNCKNDLTELVGEFTTRLVCVGCNSELRWYHEECIVEPVYSEWEHEVH